MSASRDRAGSHSPRVLVIGLDGASWNVLRPMMSKGDLPNISSLVGEGAAGDLESCLPYATLPAWTCYSTGMNPGRLGVYGWFSIDFESRKIVLSNTSSTLPEIWDILSQNGFRVGVINTPGTYPPKSVNGVMISGPPTSKDTGYAYPPELETTLRERFDYRVYPRTSLATNKLKGLKEILELIGKRFDVAKTYIHQTDFLQVTVFYIDHIQHYLLGSEHEETRDAVTAAWRLIDARIGGLLELLDEEATVLLVSDHGFGEITETFYINEWLATHGFLRRRRDAADVLARVGLDRVALEETIDRVGVRQLIQRTVPRNVLYRLQMRVPDSQGGKDIEGAIDWERTVSVGLSQGPVYLRKRGLTAERYHTVRDTIVTSLLSLRSPTTRKKVVEEVLKKEAIFDGPFVNTAPDLMIIPNEGIEISSEFYPGQILGKHSRGWIAGHRREGIIAARGPAVRRGVTIRGAKIYDMAPTILNLFGIRPEPSGSGRVLREICGGA